MNLNHIVPTLIRRLPRWHWVLWVGVVALASGIRFAGLGKGLPYTYYPDEPNYVDIVQRIFKTGDPNPRFFYYPSGLFYINSLAYIPYYLVGLWTDVFHNLTDIRGASVLLMGVGLTDLPSAFLLGRGVTALFGIASIGLIYIIGLQLTGNWQTGLGFRPFFANGISGVARCQTILSCGTGNNLFLSCHTAFSQSGRHSPICLDCR